jgi:mannan endo-1,4-beta-mannosidase
MPLDVLTQCYIAGTSAAASTSEKSTSTAPGTTLVTSTTSSAPTGRTLSVTSYAKTNGHLFTINGKTKYFMGTNTYWIGFLTNNADVDLVMSHLASVSQLSSFLYPIF